MGQIGHQKIGNYEQEHVCESGIVIGAGAWLAMKRRAGRRNSVRGLIFAPSTQFDLKAARHMCYVSAARCCLRPANAKAAPLPHHKPDFTIIAPPSLP